MIKWIYKPKGACPVQAEGFFMGHYFYFRARWDKITIDFSKTEEDWRLNNLTRTYLLCKTNGHTDAGWISEKKAIYNIYKGCIMFLFKLKSTSDRQ